MRERPSPNHDARPDGVPVDILLLHYTGMRSCGAAIDRLCDPEAKVSAHYVIDEDGTVTRLVREERRAWHAGVSCWHGARDINARSIGIELVNPGHEFGYRPFPEAQMAALEALAVEIVARHAIPRERVLAHSDVAPERKQDPGELFDWEKLARRGLGLWPAADFRPSANTRASGPDTRGGSVLDLQATLAAIGYDIRGTGVSDPATAAVVTAFQRHFRPARVDGVADPETVSLARHLARRR